MPNNPAPKAREDYLLSIIIITKVTITTTIIITTNKANTFFKQAQRERERESLFDGRR